VSRTFSYALLSLALLAFASCDKVPLLAPTGSSVTLTINTTSLPLNGTAEITAVVVEAAGTAPHNGTVVTFTSTLGSIEPREARTTNGLATATFRAGGTSGTARLGAVSGEASAEIVEIQIGGAAANAISLRAEPGPSTGTVTIVATVVDEGGNPLRGVVVAFSADNGQVSPGSATTDNNGEARTTVTTGGQTVVTARVGQTSQTITIPTASATLAVTTTNPEVGVAVNFTFTPSGTASFRDVVIDFGDGSPTQSLGPVSGTQSFSHIYRQRGTYTVRATATTAQGLSSESRISLTVNNRGALSVTLAASPNPASLASTQGTVTLTATVTPPAGSTGALEAVFWTFGDGQTQANTSTSISHRYAAANTYTASVLVRFTDGREGNASITVRITP
jgi:Bacterial Ig-like domain (group 1)/PKD domain